VQIIRTHLHLALQRLYVVYDLVQHHGLPGNLHEVEESLEIEICVCFQPNFEQGPSMFTYLAAAWHEVLQQLHALADLFPPHLKRAGDGDHQRLMFSFFFY
jgi:hypothetical protein